MIELQNITKVFEDGTIAVDELSFEIREGETFGLIGTSGCGKTTTLKMINRLVEPSSGTISIDGKSSTFQDPEKLRRQMGYVIQDVGLFPHYSVQENIATVPKLLDWDERRIASRSEELLQMVGLAPETYAHRQPKSLSGGQQQRVGLARALAADPPIILMDEPFGALDPITKQQIRAEVSDLFDQINKTIVLVTHDVFEAFELCDRLCLLDNGKMQQIGTPQELLFHPANNFVDSFFASNRFQLEMLSVKMDDLFEIRELSELYWSPPLKGDQEDSVQPDQSLYQMLEQMEQSEHQNIAIIHRAAGQVIDSLGFSDLLDRFQQYKRMLKAGGADG
ncbi:MAG: ATP-binding cassette domain-containing protein [Fodinibius sp.]|nr:ATP-binding cassette domain-containing protein [Fodinibius sp.]